MLCVTKTGDSEDFRLTLDSDAAAKTDEKKQRVVRSMPMRLRVRDILTKSTRSQLATVRDADLSKSQSESASNMKGPRKEEHETQSVLSAGVTIALQRLTTLHVLER